MLLLLTWGPGLIALVIYEVLKDQGLIDPFGFYESRESLLVIVSTFCFTMLGFFAALVTIMFNFVDSRVFKRYRERGYFAVFMVTYVASIFSFLITFVLAVLSFAQSFSIQLFPLTFGSLVNNIVQLILVFMVVMMMSVRAMEEREKALPKSIPAHRPSQD